MKRTVFGIALGFLVGTSLLAWAVGATPFDSIIVRNTTLALTSLGPVLLDNQKELRLGEPDGAGAEYVAVKSPATLAANRTCTLEDDATPFDSCVTATAPSDATYLTASANGSLSAEVVITPTDDNAIVANGTTWQIKALTDCNAADSAVTYDTATNVWGCNTIASGSGDSVTINSSAATDANLLDGDIDWTLDTGTTPDNITATVACSGCVNNTDLATDSVEAAEIAADAVGEPELKAVNSPTDEFVLTYESTTGDFEWEADAGGGGKPWEKFTANQAFLPAASFATQDTRNTHPVLDFDATADECAYFGGFLNSSYAGGGLNVVLAWLATSATTGATGWLVAIEAHPDDALDLDADSFVADNSTSATTASATGEVQYTTIAFTDGADMDSLAAGESYRLRVCRDGDGSVVTDDMAGDAELYKVIVVEP